MTGQANLRMLDERDFARGLRAEEARARVRAQWIDRILQLAIGLLTLAAIGLVTSSDPAARWGHVAGLASQPFWIAATWRARQWGMLVVAIALCIFWGRGVVSHFF